MLDYLVPILHRSTSHSPLNRIARPIPPISPTLTAQYASQLRPIAPWHQLTRRHHRARRHHRDNGAGTIVREFRIVLELVEIARRGDRFAVGFHQRKMSGQRVGGIRHRLLEGIAGRDAAGTSGKLTP